MLNKFDSPLSEGSWRAVITAFLTFLSATLITYQANINHLTDPERIKEAVIAGAILALAPFVSQVAMAASDQSRADRDVITRADVPVAAEGIAVRRTP